MMRPIMVTNAGVVHRVQHLLQSERSPRREIVPERLPLAPDKWMLATEARYLWIYKIDKTKRRRKA